MNLATFVVAAILAVIVFNIVKSIVKKGGNTCGCDCAHCSKACAAGPEQPAVDDDKGKDK